MNKKTILIWTLFGVFLVFAGLYFFGVFDKKPAPVEEPEIIESTEAIGNMSGIDNGKIEFDENGNATNLAELEEENPPVAEEKEFSETNTATTGETTETASTGETTTTTDTGSSTTGSTAETTSTGSGGGTTTYNGRQIRVVDSLVGLSPQKPFETVMYNGVPYKWDGSSKWFDCSQNLADSPNEYSDINLINGQWSGEHVGN